MAEETETQGEAAVEYVSAEEFETRLANEPDFAQKAIDGLVRDVSEKPTVESTPVVTEEASAVSVAPAQTEKETFKVLGRDGKTVVQEYTSVNELMKAVREKELFIQEQREKYDTDINSVNARIAELQAKIKSTETGAKVDAKPVKEEAVDIYSEEYLKSLDERVRKAEALEARFNSLQEKIEAQEKSAREREERNQALKADFTEANKFFSEHPEFGVTKSVDVLEDKYTDFLHRLGVVARTDGTLDSNLAAFEVLRDSTNPRHAELKERADNSGVVLDQELSNYLGYLELRSIKENKYKNLLSIEEIYTLRKPTMKASTSKESDINEIQPSAIEVANRINGSTARDISPSGTGDAPMATSNEDIDALLEIPAWDARLADPVFRKKWEGAYRSLGQKPPVNKFA